MIASMPYESNKELPENVRDVLPAHAKDIYRKAYNNAWDQYSEPENRKGDDSREEVAHKVAWSAVKQEYHKEGDDWVKND